MLQETKEDIISSGNINDDNINENKKIERHAISSISTDEGSPPSVILASAGYDHTIRFWDVVQGTCIGTLQHNESHVNYLALSRDKYLLAAGGFPAIRLYDTVSATKATEPIPHSTVNIPPIHVFEGHQTNIMALGFSIDSTWLWSASQDGEIHIWDLETGYSCLKTISVDPLTSAILHPDQKHFLVVDDVGKLKVWSKETGQCIGETRLVTRSALRDVGASAVEDLVTAIDHNGNLHIWRLTFDEPSYGIDSNSNNNNQFTAHFQHLISIKAHQRNGIKCLFSPDSKSLVTTSADLTAKIWTLSSSETDLNLTLKCTLVGHTKWVWDCAFSADSAYVLTASSDESIRLWDIESGGTCIAIYAAHSKAVICVALNDLPIPV